MDWTLDIWRIRKALRVKAEAGWLEVHDTLHKSIKIGCGENNDKATYLHSDS
jgi:hypothetical protein